MLTKIKNLFIVNDDIEKYILSKIEKIEKENEYFNTLKGEIRKLTIDIETSKEYCEEMKKKDDKEIIDTSLKSLKDLKYSSGTLTIGNVEIFNLLISKLDIPKRWKLRLTRHFWREDYFSDLLKRLETNSDVDPTIVEVDKRRYLKMLKDDQSSIVAGRTLKEILERFDKKIKDPRRASKGSNTSKIIKEFLKIKCPINKAAKELNKFFKKNKNKFRTT